jgi:hypothetical protein
LPDRCLGVHSFVFNSLLNLFVMLLLLLMGN